MVNKVLIWDLPLRIFHCLLVISVASAYVTGSQGGLWLDWHSYLGVFILSLIVFRIVWGFIGTNTARFSSFFPTPTRLCGLLSSEWHGGGHNPLGALSVLVMMGCVLTQAGLGLFAMDGDLDFNGPFRELVSSVISERLTSWHSQFFYVLLFFIGLHVVAIAYYTLFKQQNLLASMVTGKVIVTDQNPLYPMRGGGKIRFLLAGSIATAVFWMITTGTLTEWLLIIFTE